MKLLASVFFPGQVLEPWCRLRWRAAPPSWGGVQGIDGSDRLPGGRELKLVGDCRRIATAWGRGWLHLQDQEMARCRSARKSMRTLQQLTCLTGNDECRERIMKW